MSTEPAPEPLEDCSSDENASDGSQILPDILIQGREPLVLEHSIFSGFLKKKGERRRTWKKRWFVLRPTRLHYYKNEKEYELLAIIDLDDVHTIAPVPLKGRPFVFGLVTRLRTFYFQAPNEKLLDHWLSVLKATHESAKMISDTLSPQKSFAIPELSRSAPQSSSFPNSPLELLSTSDPTSPSYMGAIEDREIRSPPSISTIATSTLTVATSTAGPEPLVASSPISEDVEVSPSLSDPNSLPESATRGILMDRSSQPPSPVRPSVSFHLPNMAPLSLVEQEIVPDSVLSSPFTPAIPDPTVLSSDDEEANLPAVSMIENQDTIVKQGFLKKQSTQLGKPFKKRWFVLRKTGILTVYKNAREYQAQHVIQLSRVLDILDIDPPSKSHPFCFKIVDAGREYILSAETSQECVDWIRILEDGVVMARSIDD